MMNTETEKAARAVIDAWVIEGPNPKYHQSQMRYLQKHWPTLAKAITRLVYADSRYKKAKRRGYG